MRDITLGDTFTSSFTTRNTSGVPTTLAGTPAVSVYYGSNLTEITAGVTLGVDHDGRTGLNLVTVVATTGNGYTNGIDCRIVITAGTVSGSSVVGEVVEEFTISRAAASVIVGHPTQGVPAIFAAIDAGVSAPNAESLIQQVIALLPTALDGGYLKVKVYDYLATKFPLQATTEGNKLDVTATGEAGIDLANVGSPTTVLALSGLTIKNVTDVLADTANIKTRIPAALLSGRIDATVGAYQGGTPPTSTEVRDAIFARTFHATKMLGLTFEELIALLCCAAMAKCSQTSTNAPLVRNLGDTANALAETTSSDGRSAVTLSASSVR